MMQTAIGLSIVLGFAATELLGLYTGGLISAGYLAFFLEQPYRLLSTAVLSVGVCLAVRLLGKFVILYGRRRFMALVLLGLIGAWALEQFSYSLSVVAQDMRIVGYMIPGLIANDMLKQGIVKTAAACLTLALLIRLIASTGILQ